MRPCGVSGKASSRIFLCRGGPRRLWLGLVAGLLIALGSSAARADDALAQGQSFAGFIDLDGQQIALPAGSWMLAGRGYEMLAGVDDLAYGAIESVVLFRIEGRAVTAFVVAHRNLIPIADGWGTAAECLRDDVPVAVTFDDADGHGFCGFVAAVDTASAKDAPQSWRAALLFARQRGLGLPHGWLVAGLRLSDRHDVIDARYYFSAAARRAPSPVATPSTTVARDPASAASAVPQAALPPQIAELGRWLQDMRTLVALGFNNGLATVAPMPMPWPGEPRAAPQVAFLRLQRLDALRAANAVPDAFYARQRRDIANLKLELAPLRPPAAEPPEQKALVQQLTMIAENFVVSYLVLGSFVQAIGLLPWQMTADMAQHSLHDLGWNTYERHRAGSTPTIDFAEVGVIRAAR